MENQEHETVALCMPVYDKVHPKAWKAHVQLAMHLGATLGENRLAIFYVEKLPQPHAQNYLFESVLTNRLGQFTSGTPLSPASGKGRADWILWIEDDTLPPPDAFQLLREHADPVEKPVMHGLSFDRVFPHAPSIWKPNGKGGIEPIWDWKDNTLYRIVHSGTCCSLIHTSVFEKLARPWFRMQPFENFEGCQGMIPCISLSQRMREANIPIWAFTGCIAYHMAAAVPIGPDISRRVRAQMTRVSNG